MADQETNKTVRCVIVTAERAVLDEATDYVVLPLLDGELGVLPGRAPLIGRLGCGDLRLGQGQAARHYYVDGGFAHVRGNVVSVLTNVAVRGQDLNADVATREANEAVPPGAPAEQAAAIQRIREKARVKLRILEKLERHLSAT